jgi:uncharacterized protein YecA (UPF0149 family)
MSMKVSPSMKETRKLGKSLVRTSHKLAKTLNKTIEAARELEAVIALTNLDVKRHEAKARQEAAYTAQITHAAKRKPREDANQI